MQALLLPLGMLLLALLLLALLLLALLLLALLMPATLLVTRLVLLVWASARGVGPPPWCCQDRCGRAPCKMQVRCRGRHHFLFPPGWKYACMSLMLGA
jgi:hypothetical protein